MTLTIELPDDTAATALALAQAQGQDLNTFAVSLIQNAASVNSIAPQARPRSLMEFAGVGAGRPGSVGANVDDHISRMRAEWEEHEQDLNQLGSATGN